MSNTERWWLWPANPRLARGHPLLESHPAIRWRKLSLSRAARFSVQLDLKAAPRARFVEALKVFSHLQRRDRRSQ
jgi:hypothetical protein